MNWRDANNMSEFFFIRHGETDWNVAHRMQGATDIPLNDTGRAQAKAAREFLVHAGITRLISSPLIRAFETAQILNDIAKLPLHTVGGLSERSFGIYEGRHRSEAPTVGGHVGDGDPHEKIEAFAAVAARARSAIDEAIALYPDDRIAFVSHGAVFSALHHDFCGERRGCDNAVPYHFRKMPERWNILEFSWMKPAA